MSKISSTSFGQSFANLQERKPENFTAYGIVSCCCGRQGFGERQHGTTCTVHVVTRSFAHLQERKTEIFTAYGILLLW